MTINQLTREEIRKFYCLGNRLPLDADLTSHGKLWVDVLDQIDNQYGIKPWIDYPEDIQGAISFIAFTALKNNKGNAEQALDAFEFEHVVKREVEALHEFIKNGGKQPMAEKTAHKDFTTVEGHSMSPTMTKAVLAVVAIAVVLLLISMIGSQTQQTAQPTVEAATVTTDPDNPLTMPIAKFVNLNFDSVPVTVVQGDTNRTVLFPGPGNKSTIGYLYPAMEVPTLIEIVVGGNWAKVVSISDGVMIEKIDTDGSIQKETVPSREYYFLLTDANGVFRFAQVVKETGNPVSLNAPPGQAPPAQPTQKQQQISTFVAPSFKASAPEVTANVASAITTRSFSPPQFSGAMTITLFFIIIVGIINILTMIASLTQGDKITVIVMFFNLLLLVIFRTVPLVYNTLAPLSFWFSLYFLLGPPAILFGISALDKEEKTDINTFVLFARRDATPVASYLLALVAVIELWGLPGFNFLQFPPTGWLSPINILILVALGLYGWEVWLRTRVQTIIQVIGMILLYFSPLFNIETLPGFMQNRLLLYITWILTVSALGLWYRMRAFESVDKFHEIYNPVLATKQASAEGKGKLENSLLGMFLDGVVDPLALTMTLLTMYIILMLQSNINFLF